MGLFKKKANAPVEADAATNVPSKKGGRNKKNELVKVLDESVWESVHEELKNNTQFVITEDGNTRYVAFLFDTTQCGGLAGKDARKDESKGSIIEAIRTGAIKTYIRTEMLMDDVFISDEVGYQKPRKEFFDAIKNRLGDVANDEILIVGDSLTSDMKLADNCNLISCFYNPKKKDYKVDFKIDYEISDLNEVKKICQLD